MACRANDGCDGGEGLGSVVIVEDDRAVREALCFALTIEGFAILAYESAEAFLRDDAALLSSCLVVDQQLPGMTGIELVAALRQSNCFIPSILITPWPTPALRIRAMQAGCRVVLEKQLKGSALSDWIQVAMREARALGA